MCKTEFSSFTIIVCNGKFSDITVQCTQRVVDMECKFETMCEVWRKEMTNLHIRLRHKTLQDWWCAVCHVEKYFKLKIFQTVSILPWKHCIVRIMYCMHLYFPRIPPLIGKEAFKILHVSTCFVICIDIVHSSVKRHLDKVLIHSEYFYISQSHWKIIPPDKLFITLQA